MYLCLLVNINSVKKFGYKFESIIITACSSVTSSLVHQLRLFKCTTFLTT